MGNRGRNYLQGRFYIPGADPRSMPVRAVRGRATAGAPKESVHTVTTTGVTKAASGVLQAAMFIIVTCTSFGNGGP